MCSGGSSKPELSSLKRSWKLENLFRSKRWIRSLGYLSTVSQKVALSRAHAGRSPGAAGTKGLGAGSAAHAVATARKRKEADIGDIFPGNETPMLVSQLLLHLLHLVLGGGHQVPEKYISGNNTDAAAALQFLERYNERSLVVMHESAQATWNYDNNLTDHNRDIMLRSQEKSAEFAKSAWKEAISFAWKQFRGNDDATYRAFRSLAVLGSAALPTDQFNELNEIVADMSDIYATAKFCPFNNTKNLPCNMTLEPELTELLKIPGNYEELAYYWVQFREQTGKKMRDKYLRMVELSNESARLNGFSDEGEFRRSTYDSDTFEADVEELWQTLKPFYQQLHAYVRRKLILAYPDKIRQDGPIPAHLLGNMWAQTWGNIFEQVTPFPGKAGVDVTDIMEEQNMSPLEMFKIAEEFFVSLGLIPMPPQFWNNSVIEKPTDREIVCHASAWDMFYKDDVRIKMCTRVNEEDLITIHHEMGHIEYFLQYANQFNVFRDGANPGFHEAVGDTLALSAQTPKHLHEIGLLKKLVQDDEVDINFQLSMALNKIAFLPFGYLIDAYRWKIFDGSVGPHEMNAKWWEYRLKYQGICPPVRRTESDFDAGAKYHVAADVPYIRYFVSYVIQFQFHKALCDAAGHKGPLHQCDIYRSRKAGKLLSEMLSLGSSVHWGDAMRVITGGRTSKMDAGPLLEYFSPLMRWLKKENRGEHVGWKSHDPTVCP